MLTKVIAITLLYTVQLNLTRMPIKQIWLHLWPLLLSHINLHKHQRCSPFCYRSTSADLQQSSSRLFRSIRSQFIVSSFYCYHCCIIFIPRFYTGTSSSLKMLGFSNIIDCPHSSHVLLAPDPLQSSKAPIVL